MKNCTFKQSLNKHWKKEHDSSIAVYYRVLQGNIKRLQKNRKQREKQREKKVTDHAILRLSSYSKQFVLKTSHSLQMQNRKTTDKLV